MLGRRWTASTGSGPIMTLRAKHDCAIREHVDGIRVMFKIAYYDRDRALHSTGSK